MQIIFGVIYFYFMPWVEFSLVSINMGSNTWIWGLLVILIQLASYVLTGLSMYEIAKNRGFQNPWLAWIPYVAQFYLLGKIADDICYRNGKKKSYRTVMLVFMIAVACLVVVRSIVNRLAAEQLNAFMTEQQAFATVLPAQILTGIFIGVLAAALVFQLICLYRVYKEYAPNQTVVFLILSIFFAIFRPIALTVVRGRVGQSIASPPGVWENGVFRPYVNPANPYGGYQQGQPQQGQPFGQAGFSPYTQPPQPGYNPYYQPTQPGQPQQGQRPYAGSPSYGSGQPQGTSPFAPPPERQNPDFSAGDATKEQKAGSFGDLQRRQQDGGDSARR